MSLPDPPTALPRPRYTVALQGFSEFESTALASFFRLAAARVPSYAQVAQIDEGDFLIANGDQPRAIAAVQAAGRELDTVFVGSHAPAGAMAWLPRPIDPMHILRELDALVEQRLNGSAAAAELPQPVVDLLLQDLGLPLREPLQAPLPAPRFGGRGCDVLVVEDSAIARKFMQLRLQRLGYRVHLARSGEEALVMADALPLTAIFLDVQLGGTDTLDGFEVCQRLRQRPASLDDAEPAIVMVTGSKDGADRVRGSLVGCDAYLTKPLAEAELLQTLRRVDPGFDPAGDTMLG
jgi:two-component system, cell cycle response regulator